MEDSKRLFRRLVKESKKSPSVTMTTETAGGAPFWQGWTSAMRGWIEQHVSEVVVILIILIFLLFAWNTLLCFSKGRRARKEKSEGSQGESEADEEA